MRVALDATPLTVPFGGTRRYVIELVRALAQQFPGDEYHLVTDPASWTWPEELRGFPNVYVRRPPWGGLAGLWWLSGLPWELQRLGVDVFHGTDFSVPYLPLIPSVMSFHDLSPWKAGALRPPGSERVRTRAPYVLRLATLILTHTEAIRDELAGTFSVPRSRVRVANLAPFETQGRSGSDSGTVSLGASAPPRPYLLFVGAREKRKNIGRLIESWRKARQRLPGLSLVLVGAPGEEDAAISPEAGLHVQGQLADGQMMSLLSGAAALVYPSLYEGFGLPVLEAMKAGVPVITSRDPAISEVASGAAVQVDVTSTDALSRAILRVATSSESQLKLREQGIRRASAFSWRRTAQRTRDVYREAIGRF